MSSFLYIFSHFVMTTLLQIALLLSWIVFVTSLLLMNPKWWLGMGIAGFWGSNEYGSKKSITSTLKKTATIAAIIFVVVALFYPFMH